MPVKAAPSPMVPQSWLEWCYSVYSPDRYLLLPRFYVATVQAAAGATGNELIKIADPAFCFGVNMCPWKTADQSSPTNIIRLRISGPSDLYWFGDGLEYGLATGVSSVSGATPRLDNQPYTWMVPRELYRQDAISVYVDNSFGGDAITADVGLYVLELRARPESTAVVRG